MFTTEAQRHRDCFFKKKKKNSVTLCLCGGLVSVISLLSVPSIRAQAAADAWPQFRGSSALLGTTAATLPAQLKVLWTYEAGDAIESSAAVVDGVAYVGSA